MTKKNILLKNEMIFAKIDIPEWFEAGKLVGIYSQRSTESYEKDTEFKCQELKGNL